MHVCWCVCVRDFRWDLVDVNVSDLLEEQTVWISLILGAEYGKDHAEEDGNHRQADNDKSLKNMTQYKKKD